MQFNDTIPLLDGVRKTRDGYLVAEARIARTGIQTYLASEVGVTDAKPGDTIRVYRPEAEVFAADALASLAFRPMTVDHPADMVTADNWKKHAVGMTGGDVARDGDFIRVPLTLMDSGAIADFEAGRRELSVGYTCDLIMESGQTPTGEAYDAVQKSIRGNHVALCRTARGGPELRLGDHPNHPEGGPTVALKTIIVDGLPVETTDAGEAAVNKLRGMLDAVTKAKETADASVATLTTTVATKDAEIATLKKQIEDSKITPAQLRDAAKAYARTLADAKLLAPTLTLGDDLDEGAIRKAVVTAKIGDAAKAWTDAQVEVSFSTLAAGLTDAQRTTQTDTLREVIKDGAGNVIDADKVVKDARAAMIADLKGEKAAA